jgi:hypothetical protein
VCPFEDAERVPRLLSGASEDQLTKVPAGPRDFDELAEQGPGGRKRDGLDGLESDNATQPSDLGAIKDLGEEATLAAPGLTRHQSGRRRPILSRAADELGQLIELIAAADERRAHGMSLHQPPFRTAAILSRTDQATSAGYHEPPVTTIASNDFVQLHLSI